MRTALGFLAVVVVSGLAGLGCDKDKPKTDDSKKIEPTPVPSDMVFNDFIPASGGPQGLRARGDGGLEGGIADVQGNPGDTTPDDQAAGGAPDKLKVTDAGSDPKAARKYTFTVGKTEKRIITVQQQQQTVQNGQPSQPQDLTLKLYVDLTPKTVKKEGGGTIEIKLTKTEIPGAPPQAASMLAQLNGLLAQFDVSPQGEAGEVSVAPTAAMQNQLAQNVLQGLSQAVQLLIAPFPEAPVGAGAKWELPNGRGDNDQGAKRFSAKDLTADGGTVDADIEMNVPRHLERTPQGSVFLEVKGKGKYTYQVKFNGMAPHVEGELQVMENLEAQTNPGEPKQQAQRLQRAKQIVELGK